MFAQQRFHGMTKIDQDNLSAFAPCYFHCGYEIRISGYQDDSLGAAMDRQYRLRSASRRLSDAIKA